MLLINQIAERRIEEATEGGGFDHPPGAGEPIARGGNIALRGECREHPVGRFDDL